MKSNLYAFIMAGGSGTRLWPRSRTNHPKQFIGLTGGYSLLQESQNRLTPLIPAEQILVGTSVGYAETVRQQLPDVPPTNIFGEPSPRGTAAAIGLAAVHLNKRDPDATMAVLTADHLISKEAEFRDVLLAASELARENWLVTLGIQPDYPETGYGYIERSSRLGAYSGRNAYRVARFVEKPNRQTAESYLYSGRFSWNSGMFIWQVKSILAEFARQMPALYATLQEIESSIDTPKFLDTLHRVWNGVENTTIDYGIMENAKRVAVLPVEIGWSDVGSWSAVYDVLPRDEQDNAVVGEHLTLDTKNSLVISASRTIATIGVEDLVIVDTDDVILVCRKDRSQDVKKLVDKLKAGNGHPALLHGTPSPTTRPFSAVEISTLLDQASTSEKALIALILFCGMPLEAIVSYTGAELDVATFAFNMAIGKYPLPDTALQILLSAQAESGDENFLAHWHSIAEIEASLRKIGDVVGFQVSPMRLYQTLAHALFDKSAEAQRLRHVLGEEAAAVIHINLHEQYPFSLGLLSASLQPAEFAKCRRVLNQAVASMLVME
ncbi:MAG TPA: mannose-1-phosphate guanylyltransferase [Anaerolineales bacterium]|nr:mannose-1-phosphate guanylyltransferase [Anaerolineales bacterium]